MCVCVCTDNLLNAKVDSWADSSHFRELKASKVLEQGKKVADKQNEQECKKGQFLYRYPLKKEMK